MSTHRLHNAARRNLLKGVAGAGLISAFQSLHLREASATIASPSANGPYGPIAPVRDLSTGLELLQLPAGFEYRSFSWTGDAMTNGQRVPGGHDGMAVVGQRTMAGLGTASVLVRNHELGLGTLIDAPAKYDTAHVSSGSSAGHPAGGNTLLVFRGRQWVETAPALGGTLVNCAGGPTPWGTWLTCEETMTDLTSRGGRKHGYVFEVRTDGPSSGRPIVEMGRFLHEAVAVDPKTSACYLTEDSGNLAGLYRFLPRDTSGKPGSLEKGGRLQAARVKGAANADLNVPSAGQQFELEWVDIANPDADPGPFADSTVNATASGPFLQARAQGALRMARGEGIWHHEGHVFIVDTGAGRDASGRPGRGDGAVWALELATMRLTALFVSTNPVSANNPDNITVSPRGGIVLCEDGGGVNDAYGFGDRLLGLARDGSTYVLCKNNIVLSAADIEKAAKAVAPGDYRRRELAGACFDAAGEVLFFNAQSPGITFAIWGPWQKGNL